MMLKVSGEVRRSVRRGFGPFAHVSRWSEIFEAFVAEGGGAVEVVDDFWVELVPGAYGWVLRGVVRSTPCLLGEIVRGKDAATFSFTMLSVTGIELRGRAEVVAEIPLRSEAVPDPSGVKHRSHPGSPSNQRA